MQIHLVDVVAPVVVATLFIAATSVFKEPQRRHFNAIMLAGAGAAYLNGGLGLWEFAFTAVVTYCAYQGLTAYGFLGLGWLLQDRVGRHAPPEWDPHCAVRPHLLLELCEL